jgi:hypothetical protein
MLPSASRFFEWLGKVPDWRFTGTLYLLRWAIVVPLGWMLSPFITDADTFQFEGNVWTYLLPFLIVAPTLETLIECSLPHWIMYRLLKINRQSPWPFVFVSAALMVVLHPWQPIVILMASITGSFLAYVYFHFAALSGFKAFLHTAVFHAGINLVGWTLLLMSTF